MPDKDIVDNRIYSECNRCLAELERAKDILAKAKASGGEFELLEKAVQQRIERLKGIKREFFPSQP